MDSVSSNLSVYINKRKPEFTVDELWAEPGCIQWYDASLQFVESFMHGGRGECLVIGSPLFEVRALERSGWDVTYLDVREPPIEIYYVKGDATDMPFDDESFDGLSSTCVICHAGLGRYGDDIVEDGDKKALAEMSRVLKSGSRATIMFGPVIPAFKSTITVSNVHRVYNPLDVLKMADDAGFAVENVGIWNAASKAWMNQDELDSHTQEEVSDLYKKKKNEMVYCYLSTFLRKK